VAAVIGGGATSLNTWLGLAAAKQIGMDVPSLNLSAVGVVFLSGAVTAISGYLMKSPLPQIVEEETEFIKKPKE
jgi:hypothetical protein